jgi:hypothetical protein
VPSRASTMGRDYDPCTARPSCRAGQALLNDRAHLAIYIGPHLSCRHLVHHATFLSLLMHPPSRHPILARGRGSRRLLPVFVWHQLRHWPAQCYCTSMRTFHIIRAPSFSPSSDVTFVFPAFVMFFLSNLLHRPRSHPRADQCSSTRVRYESVLLLAFLCALPMRTRWHLPHLGYLGDEESRSEILDNQGS